MLYCEGSPLSDREEISIVNPRSNESYRWYEGNGIVLLFNNAETFTPQAEDFSNDVDGDRVETYNYKATRIRYASGFIFGL